MRAGKAPDINTALQSEATGLKALHNAVIQPVSALIQSVIVVVGEQPPSSMTPIIAVSKSGGLLVMGGSGGSMITSAVALVSPLNSACTIVCLVVRSLTHFSFVLSGNNESSVAGHGSERRHRSANSVC